MKELYLRKDDSLFLVVLKVIAFIFARTVLCIKMAALLVIHFIISLPSLRFIILGSDLGSIVATAVMLLWSYVDAIISVIAFIIAAIDDNDDLRVSLDYHINHNIDNTVQAFGEMSYILDSLKSKMSFSNN